MKQLDFGDITILVSEEDNKIGIDNFKKVAAYTVKVHKRVKSIMADGKVTWFEALTSLGYLKGLLDIINHIDLLNEERKDFTASELEEIYAILDEGIGLNESVDQYFEEGLALLVSLNSFGQRFA